MTSCEPQNQGQQFFILGLKTGIFCLGLKTKWSLVYRLRHKTNRGRSVQDTCRDLSSCFDVK
jgi:hypothetical protein